MEQEESTYKLPEGWIWTTIGEIGIVTSGGTPKTNNSGFWGGKIPWVTPADLSNYKNVYIEKGSRNITEIGLEYSSAKLLPKGSILFSSRAPIGYVAIAKNEISTNQGFKNIIPTQSLFCEYIYYYLKTIKPLAEKMASGTTFLELSASKFAQLPIPFPPLSEQHRIVARIEELFSELDHAEEGLKKAQKQLEVYKQALLKSAFEGKLTEKWREGNSSPKWRIAKIGDYSLFIGSGSTPKGGKSIYSIQGIPFIRSLNVRTNHFSWEDIVYISEHIHDTMSRTHTKPKDVLLDITGASIGRCAYIPEILKEGNVNQHVCIIRLNEEEVNYKYLTFYLNSPKAQIIIKRINSGATREALTLDQIKNFVFPLCTIDEQNLIVQELDAKYSLIENLESSIILGLEKIEKSRLSILKESFGGKLVPQNSNEESAQALIKKIQIEKNYYSLNSANNNVAKIKTMKNKLLIDILNENFIGQEFSFDEIKNKTFISYDELKDQLYHLLDKLELEMIYSQEFQRIQFKLRS